jgi:DeoR family transcriptional regulator of aga operon
MDRYSRLNTLLEMLAEHGKVDVDDAVVKLGVSPATVRRDLAHLHSQQLATRTHGGAVATSVSYDLPLRFKTSRFATEKGRIAHAAAALVPPGAVICLNGGTTTLEVGRAMAARADLAEAEPSRPQITVVTNAVNIASELLVRPHLKVVMTGGVVRSRSFELFGPLATKVIAELSIDITFLGVDGFDPVFGASAHSDAEAQTNAELMDAAARRIVVSDSSKLGFKAFARICEPNRVDMLVTDSGIDDSTRARFEDAGLEVLAV